MFDEKILLWKTVYSAQTANKNIENIRKCQIFHRMSVLLIENSIHIIKFKSINLTYI